MGKSIYFLTLETFKGKALETFKHKLLETFKGKYFQSKLNPLSILEFPKDISSNLNLIDSDSTIPVWDPLGKKQEYLELSHFPIYNEISKKKFEKIKKMYNKGLENQIQEEFESDLKNSNKVNLSAKKRSKRKNFSKTTRKYLDEVFLKSHNPFEKDPKRPIDDDLFSDI